MNSNERLWLDILGSAVSAFILVGVVIFMITPKPGKREFAELGIYLCLSLLTESIVNVMIYVTGGSHNFVYNIFNMTSLPLIVMLYKHRGAWKDKGFAGYIIAPFILLGLVNFFLIQGPFKYNTYTLAVSSVCLMIIAIMYFFALIRELPTESITKLPMFWINTAVLIYNAGNFFIFLSADYLANVLGNNMIATWFVHNFLVLVYYAILWRALLLNRGDNIGKTL